MYIDKKKIEIVIARYNEDLKWLNPYISIATIYNKGSESECINNSIKLPNVGRESHTYLYHIINNYDNLADRTIFFQGGGPSFGYQGAGKGGHLFSNYSFEDYLQSNRPLEYIMTSRIKSDLSKISVRNGYDKYINIPKPISIRPDNKKPLDFWKPWNNFTGFQKFVEEKKRQYPDSLSLAQFWTKYISSKYQIPNELYYSQGAQFSVTREVIHRNSKQFYQQLIKELNYTVDPYQGYYMEWLWFYIFSRADVNSN